MFSPSLACLLVPEVCFPLRSQDSHQSANNHSQMATSRGRKAKKCHLYYIFCCTDLVFYYCAITTLGFSKHVFLEVIYIEENVEMLGITWTFTHIHFLGHGSLTWQCRTVPAARAAPSQSVPSPQIKPILTAITVTEFCLIWNSYTVDSWTTTGLA